MLSFEGYEIGDVEYFYKADNIQNGTARIMIIFEKEINRESFVLINLTMRAIGSPGESSEIGISASLSDSSFNLIHPDVFNGEVIIVEEGSSQAPSSSGSTFGGGGVEESSQAPRPEETEVTPSREESFTFSLPVDENGLIRETLEISSENRELTLKILKGTTVKLNGEVVREITIKPAEERPEMPPDAIIIGEIYELGPEGAKFDPPAFLIMRYDPESLPEGVQREDLVIARYSEERMVWEELRTEVKGDDSLIASVDHLTKFAILGKPSTHISEHVSEVSETPETTPESTRTVEVPGFQIALGILALIITFQIIRRFS
ncbi:MAG: hypothetical protein H5T47_03640 [Archaeoglobi archaeon]|nr:hypothetical protein [Candidatus Mnemosynella bozhongmuii]